MKKYFIVLSFLLPAATVFAQGKIDDIINVKEVTRIENVLASDEMRGRKVFTPDIDRAADFIAAEFKAAGLQPWNNSGSFKQEFSLVRAKFIGASGTIDGQPVDVKKIIFVTTEPKLHVDQQSGYEVAYIKAGSSLQPEVRKLMKGGKNYLVMVDTSFAPSFANIIRVKSSMFKTGFSCVFLLGTVPPTQYSIDAEHEITEQKMANVVGIIPGKSRKDEYVVFSGHYDHLGIGRPVNGDSIYNGANDDAAGTTAVILLAKYFKQLKDNDRTIVFAAFTAEEVGGYGSQYFSRQFDPEKVVAMFNIEMIGTESKWGKNSAYITGYEKTNMGEILAKDLNETGFTFYPDPYPTQQLFYRSDNATLARLGVPAHTISTSKMDSEPNYHKLTDEVSTLDLDNMAMIIKAIALSSRSIIAGKETPTRVKVEDLR
jgi:hypothetical protein